MKITVRKRRITRLDPKKLRDAAEAAIECIDDCVDVIELSISQLEPKGESDLISAEKYAALKRAHDCIRFSRETLTVLHAAAYPHASRLSAWNSTPKLRTL